MGLKIITGYDLAAWPAGGHYAYDENTYDGADRLPRIGYAKTADGAILELAIMLCDDYTDDEIAQAHATALAAQDQPTLDFIAHWRGLNAQADGAKDYMLVDHAGER